MSKDAQSSALYYRERGSGAPLIILHGFLGMSDNWMSIARALSDCRRVVLIDLPNHGRSPRTESLRISEMAERIVQLLDRLGIERADWLGHSLGGKIAMYIALRWPERVHRLIVVDIAPKEYPPAPVHQKILEAMIQAPLQQFVTKSDAANYFIQTLKNPQIAAFLAKNLDYVDGRLRWRIDPVHLQRHYSDILHWDAPSKAYPHEVLFIAGGKSAYIRPEDESIIVQYFPRAQLMRIPEAGHWVHVDKRHETVEAIRSFLSCG